MAPGQPRLCTQPWTRLLIQYDANAIPCCFGHPSIGSVRSHALAHGLCEGDHLRIVFDTYTPTASSFGITQRELSTLDATRRAVALTGIEGLTGSNVANDLARAIEAPMGSLRRALIGRGDEALLQLLPTDSGSPELDEALARLARALTESH